MSIKIDAGDIDLEITKFPAGESLVRLDHEKLAQLDQDEFVTITMQFESNDDLINLLLVTDAIRKVLVDPKIVLRMPYLPYARQDRVSELGESLSVKVIADLINSQKYFCVACFDIHSHVGMALIDHLAHIPLKRTMQHIGGFINIENTVLVAPDAGALKKVAEIARDSDYAGMICASKVRNTKTGEITGTSIDSDTHIGDKDFLIVDDICDGGRTFTELAKVLRPLTNGKIYLYVTHGIFTKGMDVFGGLIDGIFTANLMNKSHPLISEI